MPAATLDGLEIETFDDVLARWVDAEASGDAAALDALLGGEFRGDGPRGYVLTKDEWLDRYRNAELTNGTFEWEGTRQRIHDGTVVAMGILTQKASFQGADCSGRFRVTLVAVRDEGRWSIVNLQLSALADSPDAG